MPPLPIQRITRITAEWLCGPNAAIDAVYTALVAEISRRHRCECGQGRYARFLDSEELAYEFVRGWNMPGRRCLTATRFSDGRVTFEADLAGAPSRFFATELLVRLAREGVHARWRVEWEDSTSTEVLIDRLEAALLWERNMAEEEAQEQCPTCAFVWDTQYFDACPRCAFARKA